MTANCSPCPNCETGNLPSQFTGIGWLKDSPPFQTTGGCCIPCSGFTASDGYTDPRAYGLQYVSISDGVGGFVETCTGLSGVVYPTLGTIRPDCCSANLHGTTQPFDCSSWNNGGQKTVQCGGGGGTTTCYCDFSFSTLNGAGCSTICTWGPGTWSCCGTCTANGYSYTNTCCYCVGGGGTTPTYTCYCRYSGFEGKCNPWSWQPAEPSSLDDPHCRFTGYIYNNDYGSPVNEGFSSLFFDVCRQKWVLHSAYTGSNNQWPTGQYFIGDCDNCSGLEQCEEYGGYWHGTFKPETGPGEAFVCLSQGDCAFPLEAQSKCKTIHGFLSACTT